MDLLGMPICQAISMRMLEQGPSGINPAWTLTAGFAVHVRIIQR